MIKHEIQYGTFGRCLELSNGIVRVVVTLDFGPRVIRYSFVDGENVMFEDCDRVFSEQGDVFDSFYGKGAVWYIYGGHRLWVSPEDYPGSFYPDNTKVSMKLTENGAVFTPSFESRIRYAYTIEVALSEDSADVTLIHRITNTETAPITVAPWPLTVLAPGGTEIVPIPCHDTGARPNRHITLWPYSDIHDSRFTWLRRYVVLKQDTRATENFKIGLNSYHGLALYYNHGDVFIKRFDTKENGCYSDGGMSFETFTNALFLEMESLGELQTMAQGECVSHTERWSLRKAAPPDLNDESIDMAITQLQPKI